MNCIIIDDESAARAIIAQLCSNVREVTSCWRISKRNAGNQIFE